MDGYQFDAFTRRTATPTNDRQALRLGGGGLAAALLTLAGLREAAADETPKPLGKKCQKDAQCASGYCAPDTATCAVATPLATILTGELTEEDPVLGGPCLAGHHYDAYTFAHPDGPLSLEVRGVSSGGGSLVDPYLILYAGGVPSDTCTYIAFDFDDEGACVRDAYLEFADLPADTYTAVVTGFGFTNFGTYTLEHNTFSGIEVCPPPP